MWQQWSHTNNQNQTNNLSKKEGKGIFTNPPSYDTLLIERYEGRNDFQTYASKIQA